MSCHIGAKAGNIKYWTFLLNKNKEKDRKKADYRKKERNSDKLTI